MDVALAVDLSSYMTHADLGRVKDFLKDLVSLFGIKGGSRTKLGIVTYAQDVRIERKLTASDDVEELMGKVLKRKLF